MYYVITINGNAYGQYSRLSFAKNCAIFLGQRGQKDVGVDACSDGFIVYSLFLKDSCKTFSKKRV
jgi:hypothetical protein